jgi:hypothetical protein
MMGRNVWMKFLGKPPPDFKNFLIFGTGFHGVAQASLEFAILLPPTHEC